MKTKIKIPNGYEIQTVLENTDFAKHSKHGKRCLNVFLQKKHSEHKNFEDYYKNYIKSCNFITDKHRLINPLFDAMNKDDYLIFFKNKMYQIISFELRIGLLKFICEDLGISFRIIMDHIYGMQAYPLYMDEKKKIREICPKEFLETFK